MRFPGATWRPTDKHGYSGFDIHSQEGAVVHSMEGSLPAAFGVLDGPRQASWHFSVPKSGAPIYQHVDTDRIAWTNGGYDANKLWWGIECEGVAGEALTEPQYQALLQVLRWLWAMHQVGPAVRQETLWEHNEMTRFGSASTACPSGRIPWARLIQDLEDEMDEAEVRKIAKQEAEFAVKVNRENQDGFNQHQFNLIQQAIGRAVTAHEATPHGGGGTRHKHGLYTFDQPLETQEAG